MNLRYLNPLYVFQKRRWIPVVARNAAKDAWRFSCARLNHARAVLAEKGCGLTSSDRRFAALKDSLRGRRCFVIGTGPSLRVSDLELLKDEITFASNRIFVCFGETDWRPTYYATSYLNVSDNYYANIARMEKAVKFLPVVARRECPPVRDAIYFRHVHEWFYPNRPQFSLNALENVYWGGTITYILIQLAVYMGTRQVYLLGVDSDYGTPTTDPVKPGEAFVVKDRDNSHFHPDYLKPGEVNFYPVVHWHEKAYEAARDEVKRIGGRICNASRGGKLELFPRANLEDILREGDPR